MNIISDVARDNETISSAKIDFSIAVYTDVNRYPPHTHNFIELQYVFEGSGSHFINGKEYPVSRGDLLFLDYDDIHAHCPSSPMRICTIQIAPAGDDGESDPVELINRLSGTFLVDCGASLRDIAPLISYRGDEIQKLETLLGELLSEHGSGRVGSGLATEALLRLLFVSMLRKSGNLAEKQLPPIVVSMMSYIENHYREKLDLQSIAGQSFYNPYYLSRLFKKHVGISVSEWLNKCRCINAAKLIQFSSDTIESICFSVGYHEKKQFYRVFKSHFGCTPSHYRTSAAHSVR